MENLFDKIFNCKEIKELGYDCDTFTFDKVKRLKEIEASEKEYLKEEFLEDLGSLEELEENIFKKYSEALEESEKYLKERREEILDSSTAESLYKNYETLLILNNLAEGHKNSLYFRGLGFEALSPLEILKSCKTEEELMLLLCENVKELPKDVGVYDPQLMFGSSVINDYMFPLSGKEQALHHNISTIETLLTLFNDYVVYEQERYDKHSSHYFTVINNFPFVHLSSGYEYHCCVSFEEPKNEDWKGYSKEEYKADINKIKEFIEKNSKVSE